MEEQPTSNQMPTNNKSALKILGIESAILLIVVVAIGLILNYFNIFSLSQMSPQFFGWLPHQPYRSFLISKEDEKLSQTKILEKKSAQIGYGILVVDENDITGRTLYYNYRGPNGFGGIGEKELMNKDGTKYTRHVTGKFESFENINGSNDFYLHLVDPQTNSRIATIRILSSSSSANQTFPTKLFVENLNVLTTNENIVNEPKSLGNLLSFARNELNKILKKGDAVAVQVFYNHDARENVNQNLRDEKGNLEAAGVYLRRFGGKEQIDKELGL